MANPEPGQRPGAGARRRSLKRTGAPLVRANYEDEEGLWWVVMVPLGQEAEARLGIPIGPPDVSNLGLPPLVAHRLHNELFRRGLLERKNINGRGKEIFAALQAAYKVDAAAVTALYR